MQRSPVLIYASAKVVAHGQRTRNNNFQSTNRWQHQQSDQFHLLLHSPDGSTTTPTAKQLSQFKVYDAFLSTKPMTHFIAQSLYMPAPKQLWQPPAHMHTTHEV
ncbi:hypothetical protein AVEN_274265-1 [Araneus ventricosus]|uniref:Uncharacterized protein n=1 Tax=Araneus ventricosus TaxID=182803 RepID=A0A4Y2RTW8_ARAVE|nr:hypothetical protein AVEN_274265-1 [Araneus ventricosus]